MRNETLLGMGMAVGLLVILIVYFTYEARKQKKLGDMNKSLFLKNAIDMSEVLTPEIKGSGLALVRQSYDVKQSGKNLGKEMTKGIAKGVVMGGLTGRARVRLVYPNAGCDYYIVRYAKDVLYFYNIGPQLLRDAIICKQENKIRRSDIKALKLYGNKVTILKQDETEFIFDIQIEHKESHIALKEETKLFKEYLCLIKRECV